MQRQPASYRALAAYLRQGGIIAYPTESCYGFGCNPFHYPAVKRLLRLKQRPQHKGLILIADNYQQLKHLIRPLNLVQQQQLIALGQQVTTCLMPSLANTPRTLRGKHNSIAIRMTAFPFAKQLCKGIGSALVSTSANLAGKRSIKTYHECMRQFGTQVKVLNGRIGKRKKPSTIKVWGQDKTIRS